MITRQLFDRLFPTKGLDPRKYNLVRERAALVDALNRLLPKYGIDNYLRICAFLGNCGIETDYFKTTVEYASGDDYDTRTDLGNTKAVDGDGRKYKGRDLTQTTGKFNYFRATVRFVKKLTGFDYTQDYKKLIAEADRLGVNFIDHPEKLAEVETAVESACIFWDDHNLNAYADRGKFRELSGIVNRGDERLTPLHWPKRNELYSKCRRYIPRDILLTDEFAPLTLVANKEAEQPQQLAETPPADESPEKVDNLSPSFLEDVVDKNVSADQLKLASRSAGQKAWAFLIRPAGVLYTALEAGNIAAWLGVVVLIAAVGLLLYWHRNDIRKLIDKLKGKFTQ